jgi:serine O-acetyltransferase
VDKIWADIRAEAEHAISREPALATFLFTSILNRRSFEDALVSRIAERLGNKVVSAQNIANAFIAALADDRTIAEAFRADLLAFVDRDPACDRLFDPLLYLKGYHAIQTHRLAHWLWVRKQSDFALYLQSQASQLFQTDIHPAVPFGKGIFLDHATGLVIGETAILEDDISILHGVTLGGTGKETGQRHPKIRRGVLIGAGAKILGNVEIGSYARIAAGSVVLQTVRGNSTVVGIPGRVIGDAGSAQPARSMVHTLSDPLYASSTRAN